jgi:hypothetical protein
MGPKGKRQWRVYSPYPVQCWAAHQPLQAASLPWAEQFDSEQALMLLLAENIPAGGIRLFSGNPDHGNMMPILIRVMKPFKTGGDAVNDPDHEKPTPEPQETGTGFFGGSFLNEIGLALLAGAAFAAFQFGGDMKDRLSNWIDAKLSSPVIAPSPEYIALQEAGIITDDVINVGAFKMNIGKNWTVKITPENVWQHPHYEHLRNPDLRTYGRALRDISFHDTPLIVFSPMSYFIELPEDAGDIILLTQRVLMNKRLSEQELRDAIDKAGPGNFIIATASDLIIGDDASPDTADDKDKTLIFYGSVDPAFVSEDDLFDQYFIDQVLALIRSRSSDGPIEIKRLRRWSKEGYKIAEVDYIRASGNINGSNDIRLSAVFYWHREDGSPWGDFGLFLILRGDVPVKKHQQMLTSLRLMQGDHEVWRGFDYDAPPDDTIGPFMHVEIDAPRLEAYGLNVPQIESRLQAAMPLSTTDLADLAVVPGDVPVRLRDVARLTRLLGDEGLLHSADNVVVTVVP